MWTDKGAMMSGTDDPANGSWTGTGQTSTNFTNADQTGGWQDPGQETQTIVEPEAAESSDMQLPAQTQWSDAGQSAVESSPGWPEQ